MSNELEAAYDAVVIGGGAAGLSGALMLARSRRSVVVIDGGAPRNSPAAGVHGLLGHDGVPPGELLEKGRTEVRSYGGQVVTGEVATVRGSIEAGFTVVLEDGREVSARRILVATGLVDELPDIPGLAERWGRDVLHCPYCHGWEVRDQAIGVVGNGPMAIHQVFLFSQLSHDVTYLVHDGPVPDEEQSAQLAARGVRVINDRVSGVEIVDDQLVGVRMADGSALPRQALAVGTRMVARSGFLAELGLKPVEHPMGVGEALTADPTGRTDVHGVWVAGNSTDLAAQVGAAAAGGAMAGAQINADLVFEEAARAAAGSAHGG